MAGTLKNVRRYKAAEKACRAFRAIIGGRACDETPEKWKLACDHLALWLQYAGKDKYTPPKPVRKR